MRDKLAQRNPGVDPQSLPYLRAVVREGLRFGMANPARLTRIVPTESASLTINGYHLPAGTRVGAEAYAFHHNPTVYPEPFAFQPERWLPRAEEDSRDVQARRVRERDAFPFGLGSRACLGRNVANHQLHVVVKKVVESGVLEGARRVPIGLMSLNGSMRRSKGMNWKSHGSVTVLRATKDNPHVWGAESISGSSFEEQIGYSRAVVTGEWVFVSGCTGYDYKTGDISPDVAEQTEQVFKNIQAALAEAGAKVEEIVRVRYMLPVREDFPKCWSVLRKWLGTTRPAATMVVTGLLDEAMKIEIEVTAKKGSGLVKEEDGPAPL
ncbi:hypothetical protein JX265_011065 [Neoarthrinium moseri]|uniref:Cytochrome P450 n=1 Tax=Neoarthrinium moseri TaxID=1658444 RepID=A0A9P9WD68_9PEZI|nr:hypothetical protein JX265_011065 [Neoarthrinium moseri]